MTYEAVESQQRAELREVRASQSVRRINSYTEYLQSEINYCKQQIELARSRLDAVTGRGKGKDHNPEDMAEKKPVIDKYWHVPREYRIDALEGRLAPEHLPFFLPHKSHFDSIITADEYTLVDDPEDDTLEMEVLAEMTEDDIVERLVKGLPSAAAFMVAWLACAELMVYGLGDLNADTGIDLTNAMTAYSARLMELSVVFPWHEVMRYHVQQTAPLFKGGASDPELWKGLASDAVSLSRAYEWHEVDAAGKAVKSKKSPHTRPAESSKNSTAAAPSSPVQSTTPAPSSPPACPSSPPASIPAPSSQPEQSVKRPQNPTLATSMTSSTGPIRTKSKSRTLARDAANEQVLGTQGQPCFKWNNNGGCTEKCPDGRKHVCRWCRSKEHYGLVCNRPQTGAKARKRGRRSSQLSQADVTM